MKCINILIFGFLLFFSNCYNQNGFETIVAKEFEKDAENVEFKMIMLGIAEKIRSLKVTL